MLQLAIAVRRHPGGRGLVDAQLRKLRRALAAACGLSTVHRVHLVGVAQLREPRRAGSAKLAPAVVPYDQVTFQLVLDDVVADDGAVPFNNGVFQTLARRHAFAARLRHFLRGFGTSRISQHGEPFIAFLLNHTHSSTPLLVPFSLLYFLLWLSTRLVHFRRDRRAAGVGAARSRRAR